MYGTLFSAALLLTLLFPAAAGANEAGDVLARAKAVSGGALWDSTTSLRSRGTLATGGLEGELTSLVEVSDGRWINRYQLGPVNGADGYDGSSAWTLDPGGEVARLDAPVAVRRARSDAWLNARGYFRLDGMPATLAAPQRRSLEGRDCAVIVATPKDAEPVTLWFESDSGLLVRIDQRRERDIASTRFGDYRHVDGLRLPFRIDNDMIDEQGHAEPRSHSAIALSSIERNVATADADFTRPPAHARARIANAEGRTSVAFDLVNNHIHVDGRVDGKPVRFLVDTGGVNLLTPAAARRLGLEGAGKLAARGVGEQTVDLALANAGSVSIGDAVLEKPVFYVIDFDDILAAEGETFDGLVGFEMFSRFGVTIDYPRRTLSLVAADRFVAPAGAHVVPFELAERIPIVAGSLDGLPVRLSIDTGSRVSLTLHSPFVREYDLVARYGAAADAVVGWGVGGASRGRPARFGTLRLGDLAIEGIAGDLYTGDKGAFASPDLAGNLGGGVLSRYAVTFDYANRRIHLLADARSARADAFDRSGLFLLADGETLKVADVAAGSAAATAGVASGDRITHIDGQPVRDRSLDAWRRWLRESAAGSRVALTLAKEGKTRTLNLVLADRIPSRLP